MSKLVIVFSNGGIVDYLEGYTRKELEEAAKVIRLNGSIYGKDPGDYKIKEVTKNGKG